MWVSSSHDGGLTFASTNVNKTGKLGWSLAGGGAVDPAGNVYFSWAGYTQNGGAKGPVYLYLSKSTDGGNTWTTKTLDTSGAPPDCSAYLCGWAFLGAQMTMTSDAAGTLYALWNAGAVDKDKGPERIYFSKSIDGGNTWTTKADVSLAPAGVHHAFPAIAAGAAGDVRISWMDARAGGLWNTYYRSSTNGGATWSSEVDLSTYVAGYDYIQPNGFGFPFGDYYEMDIDDQGNTHAGWAVRKSAGPRRPPRTHVSSARRLPAGPGRPPRPAPRTPTTAASRTRSAGRRRPASPSPCGHQGRRYRRGSGQR